MATEIRAQNDARLSGLRPVQVQALECPITGMNLDETARKCRVSRKTVWRWQARDEKFRAALAQTRKEHAEAWAALRAIINGGAKANMARFKACCLVLGLTENDVKGRDGFNKYDGRLFRELLSKKWGGV